MLTKKQPWTPEKFAAFAAEISAVGDEARGKLDASDVRHIKKIKKISKTSEVIGRTLLHFSLDPVTWSAGVLSLWIHHQLETSEIGHSALHGCWDGIIGAEEFYSPSFKWDCPVSEEAWKREHNILHHQYTNIVGKDPDLNYGSLRVTEQTPWMPSHLLQISQFFWTAPLFMWVIGAYATGVTDIFRSPKNEGYAPILPDRKLKTALRAALQSAKKMVPYSLYNFAFWPALAGPLWWKVLGGNLAADALRNIYTCSTIYAGHFGDDLVYHDKTFKTNGRGEWFKMQIEAAHDYKVPKPISILCGALDYQIEHHLFPKLPPNRLREIAPKIEAICERYGIAYNRASWGKSLGGGLKRLLKMSFPPLQAAGAKA
jgi:linoleoyl-CoA desaturase